MDSLREALKQALKKANVVIGNSKKTRTKRFFCGSFPANTCAEVEASIKKLSETEVSKEQRIRTIRCLSKRLKIMKCRGK